MTKKEAFSYVRNKLISRLKTSEVDQGLPGNSNSDQVSETKTIGTEGEELTKPLTGIETLASVALSKISSDELVKDVKNILDQNGINYNSANVDPSVIKKLVYPKLMEKYGDRFKILKSEFIPDEVRPYL